MSEQMIPEINPLQAWDKLAADKNAVLIDVRSTVEFEYVGHPPDAINIPWQEAPSWQITPDFAELVRARLRAESASQHEVEDFAVLLICRSGARSMAAAVALKKSGFKNVLNVAEGFEGRLDKDKHRGRINGWRFHNLPWVQS